MTQWLPRLFWTLIGCALVALAAAAAGRAILRHYPAEVSAKLSEVLARHIPDTEAEFASAQLRISLRGFLGAHVKNLQLRRGHASVSAPEAEVWLQGDGLAARLHSPTIQFAPDDKGGAFPAAALGGFKVIAASNAELSAPLPGLGEITLRAVNLTAARRNNGDLLLHLQNDDDGKKLSLKAVLKANAVFSARASAAGFASPPDFPAQWGENASADIWTQADLKKNQWRAFIDAQGESVQWKNIIAGQSVSVRAVVSQDGQQRRATFNAKGENALWNEFGKAANLTANGIITDFDGGQTIIVQAEAAGVVAEEIGAAGIASLHIVATQNENELAATIFADAERITLQRLTITALADAEKYLSHAEVDKFFANAEIFHSDKRQSAKVFAEGEQLSGLFGDAVSMRLRVDGANENDSMRARVSLRALDVFSAAVGSALEVDAVADIGRIAGTTRATFSAALEDAEFIAMPLDAPALRALRVFGDFSAAPDEWNLHLPWTQILLGSVGTADIDAPAISSFPLRLEARDIASQTNELSPSPQQQNPAAIRMSLAVAAVEDDLLVPASADDGVGEGEGSNNGINGGEDGGWEWEWRVFADGRDLRIADIWRYIPPTPELFDLREWFRDALTQGVVSRARFYGEDGRPAVLTGVFESGRIVIGDGWPDAENLYGGFSFINESVRIDGEGDFDGLPLPDVSARIPSVYAEAATLHLDIRPAPQRLSSYLRTALNLPDGGDFRAALNDFDLSGDGALSIAATIPLAEGTTNRFRADLQVKNGRFADAEHRHIPPLESANGTARINDGDASGVFIGDIRGRPATLSFDSGGDFDLRAQLDAKEAAVVAGLDFPAVGVLDFSLSRRGGVTMFSSALRGIELLLPAPFNKPADSTALLSARLEGLETRLSANVNGHDVDAVLHGLTRGAIGLNAAAAADIPAEGFRVDGRANRADVDGWLALAFSGGESGGGGTVNLTLTSAGLFGKTVSAATVVVDAPSDGPLRAFFTTPDFGGRLFADFDDGAGLAELDYVNLPADEKTQATVEADGDDKRNEEVENGSGSGMIFAPRDFVLTATIVALRRGGKLLGGGSGVILATPDSWRLSDGFLTLGANHLEAEADYIAGDMPRTSVSLRLVAGDLAGLMRSLDMGDFVQRGVLTVSGELRWPRPPTDLGFAGMSGGLRLDASDVAYQARGDDGGVGVSGVVSFFSVFSPLSLLTLGFLKAGQRESTMDRVECDIEIEDGVAKFPGVLIENEDVVINMTGETDLVRRRHNLRGEVKPGDRILKAVGPALWATGQLPALVVVEVVRHVFEKPLSNLGAYEYAISGDWDNPKYEERGTAAE